MLTDYAYPDAELVVPAARRAVPVLAQLRERAADLRAVYVDDLRERWSCSREELIEEAPAGNHPELVRPLLPAEHDAVLFKGQHSAFYGTPLPHLLHEEAIDEVVIAGQVTEQCVLYTALDAHVRHYDITVLTDAVAGMDDELAAAALRMMERNMGARLRTTAQWCDERVRR